MVKMDDFFSMRNTVTQLTEKDKSQTAEYLKIIDAFAKLIYQSIHIIDYETRDFEYVSDNPIFLCGHTVEYVKDMGFDFLFKHAISEDLDLLATVNRVGFDFFEKIPKDKRTEYSISYNYHLKHKDGNLILINQKLTPLFITSKGKLWKALSVLSLSTEENAGHIKIYQEASKTVYHYSLQSNTWYKKKRIILSIREKEILRLSARGFSIKATAESLYISIETVKYHRKNIYKKLKVNTISEAIVYASNNRML